jgi:hypothetical protein
MNVVHQFVRERNLQVIYRKFRTLIEVCRFMDRQKPRAQTPGEGPRAAKQAQTPARN